MTPPCKVEYIRGKRPTIGIIVNSTEFIIKDTIIGTQPLNTVTVFLPRVKEKDG